MRWCCSMIRHLEKYILEKYDVQGEHLWADTPDAVVFRAKTVNKWFAIGMRVANSVLGIDGCGGCEESGYTWIVNVKAAPDFISFVRNQYGYLPAYHMNKEHWLTIQLDGAVPFDTVCGHVDASYSIVTDSPTHRIYEAVKQIPYGRVATYGKVAQMAGNPKMSRAVGNALHKNPDPDNIPCFRVVNSKGELAGAFAFGGAGVQASLLEAEGIKVVDGKVDLDVYGLK